MASYGMLFVQGKDCPGIVEVVTEIFYNSGINLEDVSMSLLEGRFAMMLSFKKESTQKSAVLKNKIAALKKKPWNLFVEVIDISRKSSRSVINKKSVIVSAIAKDRTGIVYGISSALAKMKANITNLDCRLLQQKNSSNLYSLAMGVDLKKTTDFKKLKKLIPIWGKKFGIEVQIHFSEAAIF